jgi:EmrB/QacA subfamily drug resistance transporter
LTPEAHVTDRGALIATVAITGQLMVVLDIAAVNIASPTIRADLGFSPAGVQWVASIYSVTFAGLLIAGGRAADVYGSRRMFLLGLTGFCIASIAGGLSTSPAGLIAARGAQGCFAAVLSPATLTIIMTDLRGRQQNRAIGTWASMSGVGGGLGVFLGGLLTQTTSWRWILFINVPIGALMLAMAWVALRPDTMSAPRRDVDIWGAVTLTLAMTSLVFGVVRAGTEGWLSWQALAGFAGAVVAAVGCWVIESRLARHPLIPSRVLRSRILIGTNAVLLMVYMVIIAPWFLLSYYMQTVLGMRPLLAGAGLLPQAVIIAVTAQVGSRIAQRRGILTLGVGPLLAAAGMLVMWWEAAHGGRAGYVAAVLVPLVLLGLAVGLTLPAATLAATRTSRAQDAGLVSGLLNTSRQFGGALGLSVIYTAGTVNATAVHPASGLPAHQAAIPPGYAAAALTGAWIAVAASVIAVALIRGTRVRDVGQLEAPTGADPPDPDVAG